MTTTFSALLALVLFVSNSILYSAEAFVVSPTIRQSSTQVVGVSGFEPKRIIDFHLLTTHNNNFFASSTTATTTTTAITSMKSSEATNNNKDDGNTLHNEVQQQKSSSVSKIYRALFGFYLFFGSYLVPKLLLFTTQPHQLSVVIVSVLWLGFILAISGMEAWLKFRAPFCPRPFALDIGRTIFPALNSVESGLCLSLWWLFQKARVTTATTAVAKLISSSLYFLILLSSILMFDVIFLTPKLVFRGKQVVFQHIKKNPGSAKIDTDSPIFITLEKELAGHSFAKKDNWHVAYVLLELVKMILLIAFVQQQSLVI